METLVLREWVRELETTWMDWDARVKLVTANLARFPQLENDVTHTFGDGFYARTLRVPAGAMLVGRKHKHPHTFSLTRGEIVIRMESGWAALKAPAHFVAEPGEKVIFALTDARMTTMHAVECADLEQIETALVEPPSVALALESEVVA
jgi:hypothetical protein